MNKQWIDKVNKVLFERIVKDDLCENFDSLAIAISEKTNVPLNDTKTILFTYNFPAIDKIKTLIKSF